MLHCFSGMKLDCNRLQPCHSLCIGFWESLVISPFLSARTAGFAQVLLGQIFQDLKSLALQKVLLFCHCTTTAQPRSPGPKCQTGARNPDRKSRNAFSRLGVVPRWTSLNIEEKNTAMILHTFNTSAETYLSEGKWCLMI